MNALLVAKLTIVSILLIGMFTLVGLGRVEWKDALTGIAMLSSSLIVALGLKAHADAVSGGKDGE
jgi:hypothetical protein